jgi:ribosome small subunit-dependent GTPase A
VVFRSSREVTVLVEGAPVICELRGVLRRRGPNAVVVGDRVEVSMEGDARGSVEAVLPRETALARRRESGQGRELVIAANVHQLVAVFAARQPRPKFGALDRLLVAGESSGLAAIVLLNKVDLGVDAEVEAELANYSSIGYRVLRTSRVTGEGIDDLASALAGRASVVSGPSGAGKSSLIAPIIGIELRVGAISAHNEKGRHTTTVPAPRRGSGPRHPGIPRLRALGPPAGGSRLLFSRPASLARRLSLQGLPPPRGARLRRARGGCRGGDRGAALPQLPGDPGLPPRTGSRSWLKRRARPSRDPRSHPVITGDLPLRRGTERRGELAGGPRRRPPSRSGHGDDGSGTAGG